MGAIKYIDFTWDALVQESYVAMTYSKGGLTSEELKSMPFDKYEKYIKEAIRIQELQTQDEPNQNLRRG